MENQSKDLLTCYSKHTGYSNFEEYALDLVFIKKDFIKCFRIAKMENEYLVSCITKDSKEYFVDGMHYENINECLREISEVF